MRDRLFRRKGADGQPTGPWLAWGWSPDGNRWQRSTKQIDRKAAETVADQYEREAADPTATATKARRRTTLSAVIEVAAAAYEATAKAGKGSEETRGYYTEKIGVFRRLWGDDFPVVDITAVKVDEFIETRRGEPRRKRRAGEELDEVPRISEHTIRKELTALSVTLQHARRAGLWDGDPATILPVRFGAAYKPRERALSRVEFQSLFAELQSTARRFRYFHAARAAFLVATGARWQETKHALRADVASDLSYVRLRGTKTDAAARVVPVMGYARPFLAYAVEHGHGGDTKLFHGDTSFQWVLHRASRRLVKRDVFAEPCSANDLRRTTATWMAVAGATPDLIAPVLGHVDSAMVERVYRKMTTAELAALLQRAMGAADVQQTGEGLGGKSEGRADNADGGDAETPGETE